MKQAQLERNACIECDEVLKQAAMNSRSSITIFHSPDSDDAFMFYGLVSGAISHPDFKFDHDLSDIETLNQRALKGELDVTAVSVHACAYLKDYVILDCGASMGGKDYGPRLVSKSAKALSELKEIAIPGELTSAALALRIYLREQGIEVELPLMSFDAIQDAVKNGSVQAGLLIHEGQLTHQREGLATLADLGRWWWEKYSLPLPLGVNVARRSIGAEAISATAQVLKGSIEYSLAHREEALKYALQYGRGLSARDADTFVGMYVNERTVSLGAEGKKSIELFIARGKELEILPTAARVEFALKS